MHGDASKRRFHGCTFNGNRSSNVQHSLQKWTALHSLQWLQSCSLNLQSCSLGTEVPQFRRFIGVLWNSKLASMTTNINQHQPGVWPQQTCLVRTHRRGERILSLGALTEPKGIPMRPQPVDENTSCKKNQTKNVTILQHKSYHSSTCPHRDIEQEQKGNMSQHTILPNELKIQPKTWSDKLPGICIWIVLHCDTYFNRYSDTTAQVIIYCRYCLLSKRNLNYILDMQHDSSCKRFLLFFVACILKLTCFLQCSLYLFDLPFSSDMFSSSNILVWHVVWHVLLTCNIMQYCISYIFLTSHLKRGGWSEFLYLCTAILHE